MEDDARMTSEQLAELAEALSILSAQSSVIAERDELRELMEENMSAEEARVYTCDHCSEFSLTFPITGDAPRQTYTFYDPEN